MAQTAFVNREWVGNLGYLGMAPEATVGTAVTPDDWTLLYDETMSTHYNLQDQTPVFGQPFATYQVLPGMRDHKGEVTIAAEPNTATYMFDSLLTRGTVSGAGPYGWPFTLTSGITNSYTIDISTGFYTQRYYGCMSNKLALSFDKNEGRLKSSISALGSFLGAILATTPNGENVTFNTTYASSPTTGLVAGDLVRFYHQSWTNYTDTTISTITSLNTISVAATVSTYATGDMMFLRPATPSFNLQNIFLWTNTTFQFGANVSQAGLAAQLRLEEGSTWELMNDFEKDTGSNRSGNADPASLVRTTGKANLTVKKFFGKADDISLFELLTSNACIVTSNSATGYNMIVQFPSIITDNPVPTVSSDKVSYSNIKMHAEYNSTYSGGFLAQVTNALATIQ